jgi:hypothetical protein
VVAAFRSLHPLLALGTLFELPACNEFLKFGVGLAVVDTPLLILFTSGSCNVLAIPLVKKNCVSHPLISSRLDVALSSLLRASCTVPTFMILYFAVQAIPLLTLRA